MKTLRLESENDGDREREREKVAVSGDRRKELSGEERERE
jgi:hypothetical protein